MKRPLIGITADLADGRFRSNPELRLNGPDASETVEPRGPIVCDDMFFAREAARSGGGIVSLPTFLAEPTVRAGDLVHVLPRWFQRSGALWIVSPGGRNLPRKVTAFRDFALESLRTRSLVAPPP